MNSNNENNKSIFYSDCEGASAVTTKSPITTTATTNVNPIINNFNEKHLNNINLIKIENLSLNSSFELVQEKFKIHEYVLAIVHAYQVNGVELPNYLLALVKSTGTYGIISFKTFNVPPKTFSDLTIDSVYPINDDFRLVTVDSKAISKLQFEIVTTCTRTVFNYYIDSLDEFRSFHNKVNETQQDYIKRKQKYDAGILLSPNDFDAVLNHDKISFAWLETYRLLCEEYSAAIDRSIADGSKQLKKGESKFQDELRKREHEYIIYKNYRIYCGTWNVNGQSCNYLFNDKPLGSWLFANEEPPDIYAIALQEMDLSAKAVTFSETRPDPMWINKIMENLNPNAQYEELISVRLVGMMLTICVKKTLRPRIIRYDYQSVGTGALNFLGNKGGVAVSLTLNEASICFVNSHLAAHMHETDRRNRDFSEIMRQTIFYRMDEKKIKDHDHIFWIGDLNYRITEPPLFKFDYNNCNFIDLLPYDQLRNEKESNRVFHGFTEGKILFRPTYKYDPGTDNWDSSEKNRAPAWCDRILWRGERIEQISYNSVMDIRLSDHKPVYGVFLTGIKTKDEIKYKKVHEEVLKTVDKYENDNQPQITVEKTDIDFNLIQFNETIHRDFTVANNCHLPVKFSFKHKNDGTSKRTKICEDWLQIEPKSGNLITGTSLSIRVKLTIDSHHVNEFHKKHYKISNKSMPLDILVLHVEDGRDIFITIMGEYKPSCFGFNVDVLARTERPCNEYTLAELMEIEHTVESTPCKVTMPREIFLLIDYLYTNSKSTSTNIFQQDRKYYSNPNINEIRDWLDNWSTMDFPGNIHTAAEALLMLLESPNQPLLYPLEEEFLRADTAERNLILLNHLTTPRKNVFLHLCMYLKDGIENKHMNANDIASIFGAILLKGNYRLRDDRCKYFMIKFLRSDFTNMAREQIVFN